MSRKFMLAEMVVKKFYSQNVKLMRIFQGSLHILKDVSTLPFFTYGWGIKVRSCRNNKPWHSASYTNIHSANYINIHSANYRSIVRNFSLILPKVIFIVIFIQSENVCY